MLTDRNSDELREINKVMTGTDIDRMTSDKWLSSTGGLVTPLGDMDNFAISVVVAGVGDRDPYSINNAWYIVVENDMYYLYFEIAQSIRGGGYRNPIKQESVYKFPFELTRDDKKIINSMLLQLDNLYLLSNNLLYAVGYYPYLSFRLDQCDAIFNVIYNKVLEGRLERGDNVRPRANRRAQIIAQLNEATNEDEIKELRKEYNRMMRGMMGGKTRKRK